MAKRRLFNIGYFFISVAVFGWMLRDDPHLRIVPFMCMALCGFYGLLAVVALVKPNGFAVTHEVFSARKQRCLRRWALLMPLPALLYFSVYSACMEHAGEFRCLNKFFNPIAKFEKASFSRARMVTFVQSTHPRLLAAAMKHERDKNWRLASSYYKAATNLENRLFDRRLPSSYAIMGCLYNKMGRHDKAERMFCRAEMLANDQICSEKRLCKHSEIVSVPHMLSEFSEAGLTQQAITVQYPWLADYQQVDGSANEIGRQFAALNIHSKHSHDWCKMSKCGHKCSDHKNCGDKDCKDKDKCDHQNIKHALTLSCDDEDCKKQYAHDEEHPLLSKLEWSIQGIAASGGNRITRYLF